MDLLLITDRASADSLRESFKKHNVTIDHAQDLDRAEAKLSEDDYHAVVLDERHLQKSTRVYLRMWRREGINAHLVVLLPRGSSAGDRAACLDAGADACLSHPVSPEELHAHLRALRRRDQFAPAPVQRIHDLEINPAVRSVRRGGRPIHLTPREFDLLQLLASYPGRVLTRSMILEHLYDDSEGSYSNVVDVYIRYLRSKIDKGFDTPLILTCWGRGYLFRAEGA
jgi:DNA-binding response OmpR family regulator